MLRSALDAEPRADGRSATLDSASSAEYDNAKSHPVTLNVIYR